MKRIITYLLFLLLLIGSGCSKNSPTIRVALFNIRQLSMEKLIETDSSGAGSNDQLKAAAYIIKQVKPDILVLNELDHDYTSLDEKKGLDYTARLFITNYLQNQDSLSFSYIFAAPCNTGILSGKDFDNNGKIATMDDELSRDFGGDCFGYGEYPGQYSMAILSRFPFDEANIRTFQKFLWKDLPDNKIPNNWYSPDELDIFRLSSKSHWDVPVNINGKIVHILASHPTPPGFDGDENRNGRRNYDEIKMWVHYINSDSVLIDDNGQRGGLAQNAEFIIAGDLNAGPFGDTLENGELSIDLLLAHPLIQDCGEILTSKGGLMGNQPGPPNFVERRTTGWRGRGRRVDHLLPSQTLNIIDGGVFWPSAKEDSLGAACAEQASDHRLIWLDINL